MGYPTVYFVKRCIKYNFLLQTLRLICTSPSTVLRIFFPVLGYLRNLTFVECLSVILDKNCFRGSEALETQKLLE